MEEQKHTHVEHANDELIETIAADSKECSECANYLAGWKRAQADYQNLLKETEKEKKGYITFANDQCLVRLLPAIDQFETAMQYAPPFDAIPQSDRRAFDVWMTGLLAVSQLWVAAAKELGLERIVVTGPLDPSVHEAVGAEESSEIESGHIIRPIENGYRLNGKLIRPAKVIVST